MGNLWIILLTALPFLLGAGMACFEGIRQINSSLEFTYPGKTITAVTLSAAVFGTAALLLSPEFLPEVTISWLPNTSLMSLQLGESGLVAAGITSAVALIFVIIGGKHEVLAGSLLLIACSAANTAFVSGHFALRYAALEIAGLCIALLPLIELKGQAGSDISRRVYMVLRLGDAGFLVSILLLKQAAGTLDISTALDAAVNIANPEFVWIAGGFILAVWVKMGLWPFHEWLAAGHQLSPAANGWFYQTLMPNLGLYLLFRIQPLLVVSEFISGLIGWLSLVAAAVLAILALRFSSTYKTLSLYHAVQGSLAVFWASRSLLHIVPTILFLSILRVILHWAGNAKSQQLNPIIVSAIGLSTVTFWGYGFLTEVTGLPGFLMLLLILVIVSNAVWALFLLQHRQLNRESNTQEPVFSFLINTPGSQKRIFSDVTMRVKQFGNFLFRLVKLDVPDKLLRVMTISVTGIGTWLYRVMEQDTLEKILYRIAINVLDTGQWLYKTVENASLEGFLQWLKRMVLAVSARLQMMHTGKLRYNLIWVILSIIAVALTLAY